MVGRASGGESPNDESWLALETATRMGSVAVSRDGELVEVTLGVGGAGSERLLPAIEYALSVAGCAPEEVACFVVGSGPGSFTGVRIAAAMAKGWAATGRTELYAYSSLLAVAAACGTPDPVCAMFDASRGEVYAACYVVGEAGFEEVLAPRAGSIGELIDELTAQRIEAVFAGEGANEYGDEIKRRLPAARILPEHVGIPRAASLLWLRRVAPRQGRIGDPTSWEPVYVRDWQVTGG